MTQRVNGFTPPQQLFGRSQITGRLIEPDEESTRSPGTHAVHSVRQARQAEARALLDEALGLSLAARSTRSMTLCLAALARWALVASPPAPGSPSGTRWQLPEPAWRQYLADGITGNTPVVRRLAPMSAPAGPAVSADRKRRLAA
jgi:hypothetical protein